MKKIYQKPDAEFVSLIAMEEISTSPQSDDYADGNMDLESSIFD